MVYYTVEYIRISSNLRFRTTILYNLLSLPDLGRELTNVTLCRSNHVLVSIWFPINASSMASFSMPPARQARCKQQATEDPGYENKIQEAMNGLHSGRFKSSNCFRGWYRVVLTPTHQIQVHLQGILIISLVVNTIKKSSASNTWFTAFQKDWLVLSSCQPSRGVQSLLMPKVWPDVTGQSSYGPRKWPKLACGIAWLDR